MKKVTSLLLLVGVAAFGLVACGDNVVPPDGGNVEGITVTPSVLNIAVGGSGSLSADVDGDPDNSVTWSSNNASVATVDGDGNVTGVSEGNAVVKATSTVDNSHSASAEVNVTATEKAEVSIASITQADGSPIDVNDVSGQINVTLNVSEGDQSIESVELLVDGEVASSQDFVSANIVEGVEAQGEVSQITFNFRTDRAPADAAMDGTPVEGEFQNGERVISGQVTLSNGNSREATNSQTLNFNNEDRVVVTRLSGGQGVVGNGVRYWGGEDMVLAATAVLFSGRGVGSITIDVTAGASTANGGDPMTPDALTVTESPFQFEVIAADQGDVEDDPTGVGHTVDVTAMVDADGVNYDVGTDINDESLTDFFVDYREPEVNDGATSEVTVDGTAIAGGEYFSGGDFGLSNVTELGVGDFSNTFDVDDGGTSEDPDFEGVVGIDDLDEREPTNLTTVVTGVADALGNAVALDVTPVTTGADNTSAGYGVDRTPVEITNLLPEMDGLWLNPVDQDGDPSDNLLAYTAADPDLADGNPGSGYDNSGVTTVEAEDSEGTTVALAANPDDSGDNTIDISTLGDESWTVTASVFDQATTANETEFTYSFMTDVSAPTTNMSNPPSSAVNSSNTTLTFTINGSARDDRAGLESVIVSVRDAAGASGSDPAACELADDLLAVGSDPGEVDQNEVDVTDTADDFSVDFTITNNETNATDGDGEDQEVCFFIESLDAAVDVNGDNEGNTSDQRTKTTIDWQ